GVLGFNVALALATALIFGWLPAHEASRIDLTQNLKNAGRGFVGGRHSLAKTFIAIEMAMSFILLAGSVLLMTSGPRMGSEPLGFNPTGMLSTRVALPAFRYSGGAQRMEAYDRLLERLKTLPGVAGLALASKLPPEGGGDQVLEIQGRSVATGTHDAGGD